MSMPIINFRFSFYFHFRLLRNSFHSSLNFRYQSTLMHLVSSIFLSSITFSMCFSMDNSINSIVDHEDLLQQRYADINLQIQCLKKEQYRVSNNKHLYNICQQQLDKLREIKQQIFEEIINLVYDSPDMYEYL